jgi:uncharacterized protein (DUF488 family)
VATLYTIGHSTRPFDDFVAVLRAHRVEQLVDIRSIPMSRRLPQFNREALNESLPQHSIEYVWMPALGGRRKRIIPKDASPNIALRSDSFRNYADYMLASDFAHAANELIASAELHSVAYMCAERLWFHCHRMMVSDWLTAHGHTVLHIDDQRPPKPHVLMREARLVDGKVIYDRGETSPLFAQKSEVTSS